MLKKGRLAWFILIFLWSAKIVFSADAQRFLMVSKPVADLRSTPTDGQLDYQHDEARETQVLYNEILVYKGENADWYQVEAPEQKEFSHQQSWQGYPGWIRKDAAFPVDEVPTYNSVVSRSFAEVFSSPSSSSSILFTVSGGTKFNETGCKGNFYQVSLTDKTSGWIMKNKITRLGQAHSQSAIRKNIVRTARLFLKTSYLWGGRSFHMPFLESVATGVDCSGLISLADRISGIDIPRDAHEQWMIAQPVSADQLKPGDLIFISKPGDFTSIRHVMLFIGGENFIEAPGTGQTVCVRRFKTKFGFPLKKLKEKDYIVSGEKIYFGRLLS